MQMNFNDTKELLDELHDRYNRVEFIEDDPISIPHRFTRREDIEISGFLAATIAWGKRKIIVRNAMRMVELMDDQPYDFVLHASEKELARLENFVHRTFNGADFIQFILSLRNIHQKHGGIGAYFEKSWEDNGDIAYALVGFREEFFGLEGALKRSEKHVSAINKGSAAKRLNMYLRWMVRRDERGVDFGLWSKIPMSALYLPIDVHAGNMSRALGILTRKQNDWRAVEQVTENLRRFDPADPVRYDYSLFGAGVDGYLKNL